MVSIKKIGSSVVSRVKSIFDKDSSKTSQTLNTGFTTNPTSQFGFGGSSTTTSGGNSAVYNPDLGGVMTSTGKLYPTSNQNWLPTGTVQGQGYSSAEGYYVGNVPKNRTIGSGGTYTNSLGQGYSAASPGGTISPTKNIKPKIGIERLKYNLKQSFQPQETLPEDVYTYKQLYQQGNLPSIIRKGFGTTGDLFTTGSEKIRTFLGGKPISSSQKEYVSDITGGVFLSGFFSPVFTPTYAVEKSLGSTDILAFSGKSKQIPETNMFKTDAKFFTSSGKKGIATGQTISKELTEDVTGSVTVGVAKTYSRGIQIPTGKSIIKETGTFKGIQTSITKQTGEDTFLTLSKGGIKSTGKKVVDKYKSFDIGKFNDKSTFSVGKVIPEKSPPSYNIGVIKNVDDVEKEIFKISRGFKQTPLDSTFSPTIQTQQSNLATANLKAIVSAGLKKESTKELIKTSSFRVSSSSAFPLLSTRTSAKSSSILKPTTNFNQPTRLGESQFSNLNLRTNDAQKFFQPTKEKTNQRTASAQKFFQPTKEKITQREITKVLVKQTTPQKTKRIIPKPTIYFKPTIPKKPIIPFGFFPLGKKKKSSSLFGRTSKFNIPRTPSLLALGENIRSTRKGRAEFSGLSIRPIIIERTRRKRRVKGGKK